MFHRQINAGWIVATVAVLGFAVNSGLAQSHQGHGPAAPQKKDKATALPLCPVMGDPVDFSVKTMTEDGPVYFCCKMCIKKYTKNPERYAKEVAEQRKVLAALPKIQVICPVSGKPVSEKAFIEQGGGKIYFCCKGCVGKYRDDPSRYRARLADSFTYQTKCPVSGERIDPATFTTLKTGQTIYFCCGHCEKKFLNDPAKYSEKLEAQGTPVDPQKVQSASGDADATDEKASHEGHEGHDHGHDGHDH